MAAIPCISPVEGSDGEGSSELFNGDLSSRRHKVEYFGWVYHVGLNKIGHEYCHMRFLIIRGKYVEMYKRDPHEYPGIKPIRKGVVGPTLMVQDRGRRRFNDCDLYVLRFYNRLDESRKGEIACSTAGIAQKWMEAFYQAKHEAEYQLVRGGSAKGKLSMEAEIDLEGHRNRVKKYAHGLRKLIKIGQGPETLLRNATGLPIDHRSEDCTEEDGDAFEGHKWKCVCTVSGIRIFEDIAESKVGKGVLVKSVGIIDASADTVFEVLLSLEPAKRYEWDTLTSYLELVESLDGHYDVLYGTYDSKYFPWWNSKRDFVFSRQWFHGQDGTYTILQFPASHKKRPPRSGYQRTKISPSSWEVKSLITLSASRPPKCLLTLMLEVKYSSWCKWKKNHSSKFECSVPFALLTQVAGVKEYVGANPSLTLATNSTVIDSKISNRRVSNSDNEDAELADEFFDAITADALSGDENSDGESDADGRSQKAKPNSGSGATLGLALNEKQASDSNKELDSTKPPMPIDPNQFCGSFRQGKDETDTNCWSAPGGKGFMIRGKTYLKDHTKIRASDPLLKLLGVDWLKAEESLTEVALRPSCIVQSEAGKELPFILVINLQVPAKPNYNLVFYFAADRPVNENSLLGRFIDGTDTFRDARFKLIPSIVKGYWMVKRAVGTKACLLGKAVTCRYLKQDNFLEIDVDIGSSSVARGIIGLVLGYVKTLVVDIAILIEAKEESELPEHLLGTVRLSCVSLDSATKV